jgi:hypothetical protein
MMNTANHMELSPPVRIGGAPGHFWFPALHVVNAQAVLCLVPDVPDIGESRWMSRLFFSRDTKTWQDLGEVPYGSSSCRFGSGLLIQPYEFWPADDDSCAAVSSGFHFSLSADGKPAWEPQSIRVSGFPAPLASYAKKKVLLLASGDDILPLANGLLFTTLYGHLAGDKKYRLFAVTSANGGLNWTYRATIANAQAMRSVREGPSEASTARLPDGRLLCIYRLDSGTGKFFGRSISADEGQTWQTQKRRQDQASVRPQLLARENGDLLLSGGRPGIYLWQRKNGRWQQYDIAAHHNRHVLPASAFPVLPPASTEEPDASSCYTSMRWLDPHTALLAYDRLSNGWQGAPGAHGEEDSVYCIRILV